MQRPGVGRDRGVTVATVAIGAMLLLIATAIIEALWIAVHSAEEVAANPSLQDDWLVAVAVVVLLVGGAALVIAAAFPRARLSGTASSMLALLDGAVVVLVLVRTLTYDVYSDTATRIVTAEPSRLGWVAVLAVLATVVITAVGRSPRRGLVSSGLFLWVCAPSVMLASILLH